MKSTKIRYKKTLKKKLFCEFFCNTTNKTKFAKIVK